MGRRTPRLFVSTVCPTQASPSGALSFLESTCMSRASRFHGVTVTLVDTGARTIALPSTSIIGLCETFTPFGEDSAITYAAKAVFLKAKAVIIACGVAELEDVALQALLVGKSRFNAQPRLLIAPKQSATQAVATAMDALASKLRAKSAAHRRKPVCCMAALVRHLR